MVYLQLQEMCNASIDGDFQNSLWWWMMMNLHFTYNTFISKRWDLITENDSQGEADSLLMLHEADSLESGADSIMIHKVDTDVLVISIGKFYLLTDKHLGGDILLAFGN